MKKYTHAWLGLKAVERLKSFQGQFSETRNERLERFLRFISLFPATFVRGAWFPDTVVKDNTAGGHTWKYSLDPENGRTVRYRPPGHNFCLGFVPESELDQRVLLHQRISDLPDRCEALSQTIRDTIKITNELELGDVILFNNSQIAVFFLMLAHYVCDAHVPVHCDQRDFYRPSKVHPDLEKFWEDEIKKYYRLSTRTEQFDLDENQNLQRDGTEAGFEDSILGRCDALLEGATWSGMSGGDNDWRTFLGRTNGNLWDYLVSVCLVSFHMSLKMFPPNSIDPADATVRILKVSPFKEKVHEYSPHILADAIDSVALTWLATWERWELLNVGVR